MKKHSFPVHRLSARGFRNTATWSIVAAIAIVAVASALGRAAHNFKAALTDKPDVAIYLLLPDENLGATTLLRESDSERDYLAETKDGPKLVKLKKGDKEWYVALEEPLHE